MHYTTVINFINGTWENVRNKCRTTVNKQYTDTKVSHEFKEAILIAEHSPIRLIEVDWTWEEIEYWLSTEWSRHKFEKYITTQRDDRTGVDRDDKPQGAKVKFDGYANAQNLIDVFRKRLCGKAHIRARALAIQLKSEIHKKEPELADVLVPNCIYRCGCPEIQGCIFWEHFKKIHPDIDLTDIRQRYAAYNEDVGRYTGE